MEKKIRTFCAALICGFTILGVSSCALFPLRSHQVKAQDVPLKFSLPTEIVLQTEPDPSMLDHSFNEAWRASQRTVHQMGLTTEEDMSEGHIQAKVGKSKVNVNITKTGPNSVRLCVVAVKDSGDDPDLSTAVFHKIQEQFNFSSDPQ